jgi:outer membrane protein assembly factor BamB
MGGGGCSGSSKVAIYGTPAVWEDLVYIAGYNGKIYAYTTESLAFRWVYPREGSMDPFVGGLVAAEGKLYIGGSDGNIYAFDAATGDELWKYPTGDKIWATPSIEGDTLYIGSFDKKLYAIDINTHEEKWVTSDENGITGAIMATPLIDGDTVYVGSLDRNFYAINKIDGSVKWSFSGEGWFWSNPVIYNGRLYAGCLDDNLYVLDADTGAKVTEYTEGPVAAPPVVAGNSIIFASRDGKIYKISTESGDIKQLADIEQAVDGPLAIEANILFVHTPNLLLHRINIDNGDKLPSVVLSSTEEGN